MFIIKPDTARRLGLRHPEPEICKPITSPDTAVFDDFLAALREFRRDVCKQLGVDYHDE